jgi:hypothetical protein
VFDRAEEEIVGSCVLCAPTPEYRCRGPCVSGSVFAVEVKGSSMCMAPGGFDMEDMSLYALVGITKIY